MYLDANRYIKLGHVTENAIMLSTVFPLSSSERLIGTHPKEVLYLDVGIVKYILCCETVSGIKSQELFLPKRKRRVLLKMLNKSFKQANKCCDVLCKPNKWSSNLVSFGNVMSLTEMLSSHHVNNMSVVCSLIRWHYNELRKCKKRTNWGNAFFLQLRYKYWSETVVLRLILFQRAYTNVDGIPMYTNFCRSIQWRNEQHW